MYQGEPNALKTTLFGLQERTQSRLQCGFYVEHKASELLCATFQDVPEVARKL